MNSNKFKIKCLKCNEIYEDNYTNSCINHPNSLVRTIYQNTKFELSNYKGIWKYINWLPIHGKLDESCDIITYKSEGLARELGFRELYITVCGYIPERGIFNKTGTFKELEAFPTMQRLKEHKKKVILASAGNTGRAFTYLSLLTKIPVILVIPKDVQIWLPEIGLENESVKIIEVKQDYFAAIKLAGAINDLLDDYVPEAGARNIARRDGMSIVLLDAVSKIKKLPDYYFQAIGSGTGAISVWEASLRLIEDGNFGKKHPQLNLCQNAPFNPITDSWNEGKKVIGELGYEEYNSKINKIIATMLANRKPPYSIKGGLYDALLDTNGNMYSITNDEIRKGQKIFEETEGFSIAPEAGAAVYSLIKAKEMKKIDPSKGTYLINITGAGYNQLKEDFSIKNWKPEISLEDHNITKEELSRIINELI